MCLCSCLKKIGDNGRKAPESQFDPEFEGSFCLLELSPSLHMGTNECVNVCVPVVL